VYSEPRRRDNDLSLAEQYFERATRANPLDYYGHELLAGLLLRRVAVRGVDLGSRATIEQGLAEAQKAVDLRESSGTAHLLWAQSLTMLLEIERDRAKRRELRSALVQHIDQADRFLSHAFNRPDPNLTWVRVVNAVRQFGDEPADSKTTQTFAKSKDDLEKMIDELIGDCNRLEERWVASQRVFQVKRLNERAKNLREQIKNATPATWRDIDIRFW
jgi:hypothetical protein